MKKFSFLFVLLVLNTFILMAQSTEDRKDRITASYLLAFGELPNQSEIDYWIKDPLSLKTVTDLLNEHKKNILNASYLQDRAIKNSYQDAFGTAPNQNQYAYWRQMKYSYMDLMESHMRFFREYPVEFEKMIRLTYRKEFNREAKQEEVNNWKSWGIRSYLAIVQEHKKKKKAGMFAGTNTTKKINTSKVSGVQVQLNTKVAEEVKIAAAKVIATGGGNVISTGGGNVISTGGGNVISTGGLN
jgi:hypothetical protein